MITLLFYLSLTIAGSVASPVDLELWSWSDLIPHFGPAKSPFSPPESMADMVLPNGYPLEEHQVQTEDGYLLSVYRIPYGKVKTNEPRIPLLLQHGIMCSSACWVLSEPHKGLAYVLADAGYDVWLGNSRGTTWSRKHIKYNPDVDKADFWNFSFHEMGYYDLPAIIDYMIASTNQSQVFYVGHSQGTTQFFAMAAARPEYNKKVKVMSALAPIAFLDHTRGAVSFLSKFTTVLTKITNLFGIYEVLSNSFFLHLMDTALCREKAMTGVLCDNILFLIAGYDSQQLNETLLPSIADHCPSGASTKQLIHFGQLATNGERFAQFDYGSDNAKHYGSANNPDYDLSQITTEIILHYADNDWLAGTQDVENLYKKLPHARKVEVPFAYFNHLDFMWATNVDKLLYNDVVKILKEFH